MLIKLHVDSECFKAKPTPSDIKIVTHRLRKSVRQMSIAELISVINKGQTVMLAEMIGKKFIGQELLFLDIDNKIKLKGKSIELTSNDKDYISYSEIIENPFVKENAIFCYPTFNNTAETNKFRIVFLLDKRVKDEINIKRLYSKLFEQFPAADISCSNPNRLFFGTNSKVTIINLANRFSTAQALLEDQNLELIEAQSRKYTNQELLEMPTWVLIKLEKDELVRIKLQEYQIELADVTQFTEHFKRLDMGEFLGLPTTESFVDIFHEEGNPSASIFKTSGDIYLYKCHSTNFKFTGDLLRVISRLRGWGLITSLKYLIEITGSTEVISVELKELRDSIDILKTVISSQDLDKQYPEMYKYVKNYTLDMLAILDILKTSTYWDDVEKEYRALFYFSTQTLSEKLGYSTAAKNSKKIQRVLNLMTYLTMIDKLQNDELPIMLKAQLDKSRRERQFKRRANVIEARRYTDNSLEVIFNQCQKMVSDGFTIQGFNREYLLRTETKEVADRVFPQDEQRVLTDVDRSNDAVIARIVMTELENHGFIIEADLKNKLAKHYKSKVISNGKWKTMRAELCQGYGLIRIRLNKVWKEKLGITGIPSTSSPFVLIRDTNQD